MEFVYSGQSAQAYAEMNGQSVANALVPLPSGAFAIYNSSGILQYNHADWLGSARVVSTPNRTVTQVMSYAPFGEGYAGSGWAQFTNFGNEWTVPNSQARGLDDFLFRRYGSVQGRWISPDPAGSAAVDVTNPQTWNRYAYVGNDPLSYVDPLGLHCALALNNPNPDAVGGGTLNGCQQGAAGFSWGTGEFPTYDYSWVSSGTGPQVLFGPFMDPQTGDVTPFGLGDTVTGGWQLTGVTFNNLSFGTPSSGTSGGPCGGANCTDVANSMRQYVRNALIVAPLQQLKGKVVWYFCGSSPAGAIENWMETGATKGALGGAIAGGSTVGVATFGFGGVPGAIIGGFIGGTAGGGGGVLFGGMAAAGCSAAGVY